MESLNLEFRLGRKDEGKKEARMSNTHPLPDQVNDLFEELLVLGFVL